MRRRADVRVLALLVALTAACSRPLPAAGAAVSATASATSGPTSTTSADVSRQEAPPGAPPPNGAIGPLVPWLPASAWHGPGIPPKQFSLYAIPEGSPVLSYAALDRDSCEDALRRRGIAFTRGEDTLGVRAPVHLAGPLHGVAIHSSLPPRLRATLRADIIDCRLALSLDDFAASLAARGIVEATTISAYRSKTEHGCTAKYPGEQHCAALAVDVASFTKKDGTKLVVLRDFHGRIGLLTCAEPPRNELWDIACASAGRQFQVVLTPNWNAEHKNHLHLELTVHDWVLVR